LNGYFKENFNIGNVQVRNNIFLAPLASVADRSFRILCVNQGAGLTFSEMISAKGVHYNSKGSVELGEMDEIEKPAAVQIFGNDPEYMAEAAKIFVQQGNASIIDINMGCPTPKITSNGDGSVLMNNPKLAGEIVKAVTKAVSVPVTVKMRRGYTKDKESAVELALSVQENGASAVTVHGRFREEFYSGKSNNESIAKVKDALKIPVIGNGDICSPEDAVRMFEETGCDGIMIGRASLGNPWIFNRIISYFKKEDYFPPTKQDIWNIIKIHTKMVVDFKGEKCGVQEMRKHIAWYTKGLHNSAVMRNNIFGANSFDEVCRMLDEYFLN